MDSADPNVLPLAIVASRRAAPTVAELAEGIGLDCEHVEPLYSAAEARGWVEPWEGLDEPAVTLSPLGAEMLGVKLRPDSSRWVLKSKHSAARISNNRPGVQAETDLVGKFLDDDSFDGPPPPVLDKMPDPRAFEAHLIHDATELADRMASRIRGRVNNGIGELNIPLPTVLVGQRLQWPATKRQCTDDGLSPRPTDCPGCRDHPRPHEYCLICDRYGRGWMLPRVKVERRRQVEPVKAKPKVKLRAQIRAEKFARPS